MKVLSPEVKWLDTGTADSLLSASNLVRSEQEKMDKIIACLEEIVYNRGYIDKEQLKKLVDLQLKTNYGQYLENLIK